MTWTVVTPAAASRAACLASRNVPRATITSPRPTSSPWRRMFAPAIMRPPGNTEFPWRRQRSSNSTAATPAGMDAPVSSRAASPGARGRPLGRAGCDAVDNFQRQTFAAEIALREAVAVHGGMIEGRQWRGGMNVLGGDAPHCPADGHGLVRANGSGERHHLREGEVDVAQAGVVVTRHGLVAVPSRRLTWPGTPGT